jgi:hypothetical protein
MNTKIRKVTTGEAGNPGEFGTHKHTEDTVALAMKQERPRLPYWDGVRVCRSPDATVDDLQHYLDTESEDDYMVAIAGHPNATPDQIEKASQHYATHVRQAAIANPNVARATVVRIEAEACVEEAEYRQQRREEGISPMSANLDYMAAVEAGLAMRAGAVLRELDRAIKI